MSEFKRKPCKNCPYRRDVKPFLHPERAEEIAYLAQNRYSAFYCHKTTQYNDESDDMEVRDFSKLCAGYLTLMAQELGEDDVCESYDGFKPSYDKVYSDIYEMCDAYEEAWQR